MNFLQRTTFNVFKQNYLIPRLFTTKINEEIDKLVKNNKVVVFMKGVPEQPRCGFSNAVVQILRMHGVKYDAHDVLSDESLRQGWFCIYFSKLFLKSFHL